MNDTMPKHLVTKIIKKLLLISNDTLPKKALILGATFKENCPDLRNSKVFDIFNELREYNIMSSIYDPIADFEELKGEYNEAALQNINDQSDFDILIIAVSHKQFLTLNPEALVKSKSVIFDVKGIFSDKPYLRL